MEERIQEHGQPGSRLDTKAARARCEAATPEPWTVERGVDSSLEEAYVAMGEKNPGGWWDYDSTWLQRDEDADFIAHARTDLPAALEALEEAQGLPTDGEICHSCGSAVAAVWHARDEEWEAVVGGPGGIRCVRCFAAEAEQKGIHLAFVTVPLKGNWTTELAEAQGKLEAVRALALEPGHAVIDHTNWHNALDRILSKECSCGGPSTHPCGPTCKYPYTDERSKEGE